LSVTAEETLREGELTGKGGKMDKKECAMLLTTIERLIFISEPQRAEYLRGYHRGIVFHALGVSDERTEEHQHFMLMDESSSDSGDPSVDSYARGYRHGFKGMKPESPSLSSESSKSHNIASIV
jgi:hypothetical protein